MIKKTTLLLLGIIVYVQAFSQNAGIGITDPKSRLQVAGSFIVSQPEVYPVSPNPPQVTMINGVIEIDNDDSAFVLVDPSGTGMLTYPPNLTSVSFLHRMPGSIGFKVTISFIELGTGDSLFIKDLPGSGPDVNTLLAVGNNYTTTAMYTYNTENLYFHLRSNGDGSVGRGVTIRVDQIFTTPIPDVAGFAGTGFFVDVNSGSLRAGEIELSKRGINSVGFGEKVRSTGKNSFALGYSSEAAGTHSMAIGINTVASASASFAGGVGSDATNAYAFAFGNGAQATGITSFATGNGTTASGVNSIASGNTTEASGMGSVSMGVGTLASADFSLAIGDDTESSGFASFAAGRDAVASGNFSVAMGIGTNADSYGCLALGRYSLMAANPNKTAWDADDRILMIGDGTSAASRSNLFYILKNGDAWLQGTLTQASDARLKKNISPLDNALEKIIRLNGYHYNWIDTAVTTKLQTGVLAQEVQPHMPELVNTETNGELSVNYTGLIPYLIESIKELKKQNDQLQKQINELKK
ncbi:MAG TPA: tail fiber domain-containing protein [Chitinophagaceae bacterium]|jgi:hypothetical protein|nr:tail fiber domain-containing protein [Chitinophagaceae bacterium]